MSDFYNLPVGKRTRHGRLRYAQGLNGNDESRTCGFSKNRDKKRNRETEDDEINKKGSNGAGRPKKRKLAIKEEILSSDESESEEEESDENGSGDNFISSGSDESSSDESGEDSGDREESEDLSKSNEEDGTDEKGFDGMKSRPCGSSSGYGKDIEIIEVDDYWINRKGSKGSSSLTKIELPKAKPVNKSLVAQSHEEQSIENGLGVRSTSVDLDKSSVDVSTEGGRDEEGTDAAAVGKNEKKECYGSAAKSDSDIMVVSDDEEGFGVSSTSVDLDKSSVDVSTEGGSDQEGTDAAAVAKNEKKECYGSTDESDSDVMVVSDDEEGWIDYFPPNKTPNHPSATESEKEYSDTETEYSDTETETESESIQSDDSDYLLPKEAPKLRAVKEKLRSTNIKEKGRSVKKEMYDLNNDIDTHKKANGKGKVRVTDNIEKGVKNQESKKGKRKDVGGSIDAILDLIIGQEDDLHKNGSDDCIPLKFRFDDSDDDSASQTNYESDVEALFQQMNYELRSEEIGSYGNPKAENQDKNGYKDHVNKATHFNCERGNHAYIYLEEQIGLRCGLCGAVILESRHVIPKLATYAPDTPRRGYHSSEQQFLNSENAHFHYSDGGKPREICMQTKGTVWELIPKNIQGDLYPHQQKGFKFLWENLAGTIELQGLQKLEPCGRGGGGGGCIISHAPGTGKTLLTIVFIESFLNRFPKCCPLIIVPSNMLDTWEAEFKKWQVGFSFINLNTTDSLSKEMNISFRNNIDLIRAFKISSWCDGKSVLGVSYSLFEKIIGNTNTKKVNLEKMGNVLLDKPRLVILDEGHTPRNHRSNIWNILLKLKTKNRVI